MMPVKWNSNRKENEEKQDEFMSKVFGVGWREQAEKRKQEEEEIERAKAPKFPRRA
jgi:hypothetical protein